MMLASICKHFVVRSRRQPAFLGISFPGDLIGLHTYARVRVWACLGTGTRRLSSVFSGGLAPLAALRVDGTGTEQKGGPPLGRAMAWPWPLACKVRSGALGGTCEPVARSFMEAAQARYHWATARFGVPPNGPPVSPRLC